MFAICLKCGEEKNFPWENCSSCNFIPSGSDLIKSVYLSQGRFDDEKMQNEYKEELKKYSLQIKKNVKIRYDKNELKRLGKEKIIIEKFNPSIFSILFNFFLPSVILFFLIVLLLVLKYIIFRK